MPAFWCGKVVHTFRALAPGEARAFAACVAVAAPGTHAMEGSYGARWAFDGDALLGAGGAAAARGGEVPGPPLRIDIAGETE